MVIIETTSYLIFIPDDDPGDEDENMSAEGTFHGLQQQSILASLHQHFALMLFI